MIEDSVLQCSYIENLGCSCCSPGSRRNRPEISQLPRLRWVGSNHVEMLGYSTQVGNTTQAGQCSSRTVEDVIHMQPFERHSLTSNSMSSTGGRNNRTGKPINFYSTPRSKLRVHQLDSNHGTEDVEN